jgi:hypothetical protein
MTKMDRSILFRPIFGENGDHNIGPNFSTNHNRRSGELLGRHAERGCRSWRPERRTKSAAAATTAAVQDMRGKDTIKIIFMICYKLHD